MGRPAFFQGDSPGDLDTEGTNVPPSRLLPRKRRSINNRADNHVGAPEGKGSGS